MLVFGFAIFTLIYFAPGCANRLVTREPKNFTVAPTSRE